MRALSTILLILALAPAPRTAAAQGAGAPGGFYGNGWWITAGRGDERAVRLSDNASNGSWALARSKPVSVALDWGHWDRTFGVEVSRTQYAMQYSGATCPSCAGDVQAVRALGTYRSAGPLMGGRLMQVFGFSAGFTRWSDLSGRDGSTLPSISPNTDFTYGFMLGLSVPLGDRLELSAMYKSVQVRHETLREVSTGAAPNNFIHSSMLWYGLRLRLGK